MSDVSDRNDNQPDPEQTIPTASFGAGTPGPGGQVGPYKLLGILGEGGCGIVYLAERLRPVKRRVALKVIKPGMDTKQVIARFEAERQALALLDHSNIAHVFNAGTTEAGRPYFVMEYVKGVPITEHCDRQKLPIEERLDLFLQVCEAVQHAHQKGIIHRDIKPSNILVSTEGSKVVPKIIDFGVAKAICQPLTERTLYTEQGQLIGTPEFMSPEQAEMTAQDVDTRSDIYSLGVVLYVLLTGVLPFDSKTLRESGIDGIRKVIREENPKTPSTRLSTILGQESVNVAQFRRTDIRTLGRKLHGDLDWITIKALEKDRMRRYQTAHALGEDIQRHLNSEPVLAGPPSRIYRLKKLIQKHRTQAIGTAVAGILIAVIAVISVMYMKAANRNKEAESLQHTNILSKALEYRSKGQFQEALAQVEAILDSGHVGPEARWLRARTVLQLQGPVEAISQLEELTKERDEIASQAHFLLARIYLETDPGDSEDIPAYQRKGREHQQKGERLFSETAEAYFNRSMMTGTVNKTLEWLNKALDHDPGHYDSLEARALAYYALNKFSEMEIDASVMIGNESSNSRGYALRAIARREKAIQQGEKELFSQAIRDHDRAIRLSPDDAELYDQRRRTYMQMGDYERTLSDAQKCVRLQPNNAPYHFHVFCALVTLGRYGEAKVRYDTIIESGLMIKEGKDGFHQSTEAFVFDALDAGLSWHPPASEPKGAPFLSMVQADEHYRRLAKKGKRIVPDGFSPVWSPDGTELVYSRGVLGHSGIEIVNLKTGKTRLLTPSGMDPSWSPDGDHIAFVRGRQTVLLADLATEHELKNPPHEHRDIWLIKADGAEEPRFLTRGHWPSWSRDSKRVLYYLPEAMRIYSISIEEGSEPRPIVWCPSNYPAISPDGKYVAFASYRSGFLRVVDISSRSLIASWAGPQGMFFANWSSDGRRLTVAAGWGPDMGLWIYDMGAREASKVLSGRIMRGCWSPDGSRMAFALAPPVSEIWIADTESLGPGRTLEEHYEETCQEDIDRLTIQIETYPEDVKYYRWRAKANIYLGDTEKTLSDLKKYTDLVNDPNVAAEAYDYAGWPLVLRHQEMVNPEFAVELYRKAHELQPKNWIYLCGLGAAHYRAGQWEEAIAKLTMSTELANGENGLNYLFLDMAHQQSGNEAAAADWYNKAMEWIEDSNNNWLNVRNKTIYDIYLEAAELMGIKPKEF